jgi:RNA polymerase sigma-70 factor (ECF subfamily)
MDMKTADLSATPAALSDGEIVTRVQAGERALFELLMRRHNQRVYRAVRAVVKLEADVEDVMQQAYINAFIHLHQFERRAQFSTWLIRIALNEAFSRRRKMRLMVPAGGDTATTGDRDGDSMDRLTSPEADPERQAYAQELHRVLEAAVDALPDTYRAVFMLRDIEGLSTSETGAGLGLGEEAVKTRLHRARAIIRRTISAQIGATFSGAFEFHAPRCDRVVSHVLAAIAQDTAVPSIKQPRS